MTHNILTVLRITWHFSLVLMIMFLKIRSLRNHNLYKLVIEYNIWTQKIIWLKFGRPCVCTVERLWYNHYYLSRIRNMTLLAILNFNMHFNARNLHKFIGGLMPPSNTIFLNVVWFKTGCFQWFMQCIKNIEIMANMRKMNRKINHKNMWLSEKYPRNPCNWIRMTHSFL